MFVWRAVKRESPSLFMMIWERRGLHWMYLLAKEFLACQFLIEKGMMDETRVRYRLLITMLRYTKDTNVLVLTRCSSWCLDNDMNLVSIFVGDPNLRTGPSPLLTSLLLPSSGVTTSSSSVIMGISLLNTGKNMATNWSSSDMGDAVGEYVVGE